MLKHIGKPALIPIRYYSSPGFFRKFFGSDSGSGGVKWAKEKFYLAPTFEKWIIDSKITSDHDLARLASKTMSVGIYGFLAITMLGTFGVDTRPLMAGVGITGFTIGFALKEIATNFLSGILLMFQKPFEKGCVIKIHGSGGGIEGQVESIDTRYVILRVSETNALVMIPSSIVYSNPITVIRSNQPK
jgi:small conductance mechanosensitive channel